VCEASTKISNSDPDPEQWFRGLVLLCRVNVSHTHSNLVVESALSMSAPVREVGRQAYGQLKNGFLQCRTEVCDIFATNQIHVFD
jgi:hypothetical protein